MSKHLDTEQNKEWLEKMALVCEEHSKIESGLFTKYDVKRGLRDLSGQGVLTLSLIHISEPTRH